MSEQNKTVVRKFFNEVLKKGNYDAVKEIFSPSFIFCGPSMKKPAHGLPGGIYEFVSSARHAFPDIYISIENEIADEDQVAVVWRMTGTHKKPFRGILPSGKLVTLTGMDIFFVENGQIEGMWAFFEMKSALEQLLTLTNRNKKRKTVTKKNSSRTLTLVKKKK
jgi:steroid delta-isomerase-like uncharacterized protein